MPAFFATPLSALTNRWRVFFEESVDDNPRDERSDFEELRGIHDTRIYRYAQDKLAVSTDHSYWQARFSRTPGLTPHSAAVFVFPDALLDTVALAIHAKQKRQVSDQERLRLKQQGFKSHTETRSSQFKAPLRPQDG